MAVFCGSTSGSLCGWCRALLCNEDGTCLGSASPTEQGEAQPLVGNSVVSAQDSVAFRHCEKETLTSGLKGSCAAAKPRAQA